MPRAIKESIPDAPDELVVGYCADCGADRDHRVLTIVDEEPELVACLECGREGPHAEPRDAIKAALRESAARRRAERERQDLIGRLGDLQAKGKLDRKVWAALTAEHDEDRVEPYAPTADLRELALVRHDRFGLGVVIDRHEEHKACILFEDRVRTMICARPAAKRSRKKK